MFRHVTSVDKEKKSEFHSRDMMNITSFFVLYILYYIYYKIFQASGMIHRFIATVLFRMVKK